MKKVAIASTAALILCATVSASAQEAAPPPPAPKPAAAPAADPPGTTDHDLVVGHLGVGFFNVATVPIAAAVAGGVANVPAPVVGVRYWLMPNLGIDGGLGLGWTTSSTTTNLAGAPSVSTDNPSPFAFVLHGGVPLAFAHSQHFSFLVVPELNFGYATETIKAAGMPNTTLSGLLFNVGGRVGAEIGFGFIGIPQLALEGSVGLLFNYQQTKADGGNGNTISTNTTSLSTTLGTGNPWAIFTNAISAIYYL